MRITRIIAVHISVVWLVLAACARPVPVPVPTPTPGPNDVWFQDREFTPSIITVPVGTMVTWVNKDTELHTVTSNDGLFNVTLEPLDSFSYTFTGDGAFDYHDEYDNAHREVRGTVYVK